MLKLFIGALILYILLLQSPQLYTASSLREGTPTTKPLRVHVIHAKNVHQYKSSATKRLNSVVEAIAADSSGGKKTAML